MVNVVLNRAKGFLRNREGATAVEYSLFAALIAVAIIASVTSVSDSNKANFETVEQNLAP